MPGDQQEQEQESLTNELSSSDGDSSDDSVASQPSSIGSGESFIGSGESFASLDSDKQMNTELFTPDVSSHTPVQMLHARSYHTVRMGRPQSAFVTQLADQHFLKHDDVNEEWGPKLIGSLQGNKLVFCVSLSKINSSEECKKVVEEILAMRIHFYAKGLRKRIVIYLHDSTIAANGVFDQFELLSMEGIKSPQSSSDGVHDSSSPERLDHGPSVEVVHQLREEIALQFPSGDKPEVICYSDIIRYGSDLSTEFAKTLSFYDSCEDHRRAIQVQANHFFLGDNGGKRRPRARCYSIDLSILQSCQLRVVAERAQAVFSDLVGSSVGREGNILNALKFMKVIDDYRNDGKEVVNLLPVPDTLANWLLSYPVANWPSWFKELIEKARCSYESTASITLSVDSRDGITFAMSKPEFRKILYSYISEDHGSYTQFLESLPELCENPLEISVAALRCAQRALQGLRSVTAIMHTFMDEVATRLIVSKYGEACGHNLCLLYHQPRSQQMPTAISSYFANHAASRLAGGKKGQLRWITFERRPSSGSKKSKSKSSSYGHAIIISDMKTVLERLVASGRQQRTKKPVNSSTQQVAAYIQNQQVAAYIQNHGLSTFSSSSSSSSSVLDKVLLHNLLVVVAAKIGGSQQNSLHNSISKDNHESSGSIYFRNRRCVRVIRDEYRPGSTPPGM